MPPVSLLTNSRRNRTPSLQVAVPVTYTLWLATRVSSLYSPSSTSATPKERTQRSCLTPPSSLSFPALHHRRKVIPAAWSPTCRALILHTVDAVTFTAKTQPPPFHPSPILISNQLSALPSISPRKASYNRTSPQFDFHRTAHSPALTLHNSIPDHSPISHCIRPL